MAGVNNASEQPTAILHQAGVRLLELDGQYAIGIWSDLDSAKLRRILRELKLNTLPIRYLDSNAVPERFKARHAIGEPVPSNVLAAMTDAPKEPWNARRKLLPNGTKFRKWKDEQQNPPRQQRQYRRRPWRRKKAA